MKIEPSEIEKKKFELSFRGYNQNEVNQFLREVGKNYGEITEEKRALCQELERLKKEREWYASREKKIEEALISAQRSAELINKNSQERANLIIKEAEMRANEVMRKSEEKLKKLTDEIEKLEGQRRLFFTKLKSLIETHSELLRFYEEETKEEKKIEKPAKKKVVKIDIPQKGILFEE